MAHGWLLLETLGDEPVIVAQGRALKNSVPLRVFLRRSPFLAEIEGAVAQAARSGTGSSQLLSDRQRVIRTEPVRMSDGRVHGVQVWSGPVDAEAPERPIVGPLLWDLTTGMATGTPDSLTNSGLDPETEPINGRAFADDLPRKDLNPSETKVLSLAINGEPGDHVCTTWDVTDRHGTLINLGFVARANRETVSDGSIHTIIRAMNWRGERPASATAPDHLAQRILNSLARPGIYRALVDVNNWTLLKWLDDPCPYYDWRQTDDPMVHPDDETLEKTMKDEIPVGRTRGILRLKGNQGGWVPIHITAHRVELDERTVAGLVSVRRPTPAELSEASLEDN